MAKTGKRLKKAYEGLDPAAPPVKLEEAVKQIKSRAAAKFDEAVQAVKGGQVEFRAEKAGIVHAGVGKASFTEDALVDNVRAFVSAITRGKPSGVKGTYIKRVSLTSTMGPSVKVDVGGLAEEPRV